MAYQEYIKGYKIDIATEVTQEFGEDKVDQAIMVMVECLDRRRSYIRIDTGYVPSDRSHLLVIVLDMDSDGEKLKERSLGEVDPAFKCMGSVLNGPSIWRKW